MWSIFYYSPGGSVSLFTCSPLKICCKHSHLETRSPAYPNFSARISILFTCQILSAHIILPCHQPSHPVQGFFLIIICSTLKVRWPQFSYVNFMPFLSVLRTWCWFFFTIQGPPLPSLPSSMAGFMPIPPLLLWGFISVWERNYSKCGCVPAVLTEQTKRMDGHYYLGRC